MKIPQGIYNDNGYVRLRIWLGPKRSPDGSVNKPYRRTFGLWNNANIQAAKNHLDEVREKWKAGIKPGNEPQQLPVPTACDYYYKRDWVDNVERSRDSVRNTRYGIERFKKYWSARAWHTILPLDVEAYVVWRRKAGIKDNTINRELGLLSSMFAMIETWIDRREFGPYLVPTTLQGESLNPAACVSRPSTIESKRERVATDEEIRNVTIYCSQHDPDMLGIIKRDFFTGLRKADLKRVNGLANVRGVLSKSREKKLFRFPLDFSQKLNYKNFTKRWNNVREACHMMDFVWHDWRHTAATRLSKIGFSDRDVQLFLGHSGASGLQQTQDYINRGAERLEPQVKGLQGHWEKITEGIPAVIPITHKTCLGCHQTLSLAQFGKHSAGKNGLNSRCKACCYKALVSRRQTVPGIRQKEYQSRKGTSHNAISHLVPSVPNGVPTGPMQRG